MIGPVTMDVLDTLCDGSRGSYTVADVCEDTGRSPGSVRGALRALRERRLAVGRADCESQSLRYYATPRGRSLIARPFTGPGLGELIARDG